MSTTIKRPLLRYHGGKFLLGKWIVSHFPTHRCYVEPFGGAASVLLQKPRSYAEVYNDIDSDVVNLFTVCRDHPTELIRSIQYTPFSRDEFKKSYEHTDDILERARRTVVRSFQGFGSASVSGRITGFRYCSTRSGTTPAIDWKNFPAALEAIIDRLRGVIIENRPAIEVMGIHDGIDTLIYEDPPYVFDTRYKNAKYKSYRFEMTDEEHQKTLEFSKQLKGMVIISGYDTDMYNDILTGWQKAYKDTYADGASKRREVLWLNNSCSEKLNGPLFNSIVK